jgi:hypothetical protein
MVSYSLAYRFKANHTTKMAGHTNCISDELSKEFTAKYRQYPSTVNIGTVHEEYSFLGVQIQTHHAPQDGRSSYCISMRRPSLGNLTHLSWEKNKILETTPVQYSHLRLFSSMIGSRGRQRQTNARSTQTHRSTIIS